MFAEPLGGDYGQPRIIVPAPENPRYAHLSWPKIVKANDGTLVVAYIAGRKHANGDGCPAVSISRDGGKTFTPPQVLMTFDKTKMYQHCANLAMGKAEDGSIILMAMAFTDNDRNNIYGWRSVDSGKTWQRTDTSTLGDSKTGSVFGHVFNVPGNGLAVCGHYRQPKGNGIWIAYSTDHGKSWNDPHEISKKPYYEPAFIYAGGRLIGLVREKKVYAFHQFVSDDLGATWQFRQKVIQGDKSAVHPSPFLTADPTQPGTLYALQSERSAKNEIYLWRAQADALQWECLGLVTSCPRVEDFSYPWMSHLEDNKWFLVFYSGKSSGRNSIYGMTIAIPQLVAGK